MPISKITNEYITLSSTSEKKYLYSLNVVLTKKTKKANRPYLDTILDPRKPKIPR